MLGSYKEDGCPQQDVYSLGCAPRPPLSSPDPGSARVPPRPGGGEKRDIQREHGVKRSQLRVRLTAWRDAGGRSNRSPNSEGQLQERSTPRGPPATPATHCTLHRNLQEAHVSHPYPTPIPRKTPETQGEVMWAAAGQKRKSVSVTRWPFTVPTWPDLGHTGGVCVEHQLFPPWH